MLLVFGNDVLKLLSRRFRSKGGQLDKIGQKWWLQSSSFAHKKQEYL